MLNQQRNHNHESDKERNHERRMSDVLKQQKFDFIITVRYSYEFYDKEMMAGLSWPFSDYLIYISLRRRALY